MSASTARPALTPLTGSQKRLFAFLGVATFFEGFDQIALTQLLPNIRAEFRLDEAQGGMLVAFINVGTVLAYFLVRRADRSGRRPVMALTIAGYTVFSFLSGLSPNAVVFGTLQLVARIFLLAEWAISMIYAAEEFPADRRGTVIGVISAFASLGSVLCAGVVPILLHAPWGWRTVYFVGTIPLLMLAFARRSLGETRRFTELTQAAALDAPAAHPYRAAATKGMPATPLLRILRGPYRRRVLELALIWGASYCCTQVAVTFWKEFAVHERQMSDAAVGGAVAIAAVGAMPLVFLAGKLIDRAGRRRGAVLIFTLTALGTFGAYTLHGRWPLTAALMIAIFGTSAILTVLNAYTTELVPTELRGDTFAWSNNLLGRIGYVLSPLVVGYAARSVGWGPAVAATAFFPIVALVLILTLLPETSGQELEQTSRVG